MVGKGKGKWGMILILICICNEVREIMLPSQMAPEPSWGREMPLLEEIL